MALPDDFLYRLKSANRITDIMSSYASLQRAGRYYKCNCPFHSEKTPSCVIYPDNDSFYCFGCGAGGDVITFMMKISNLSYIEAVRLLAEKSGMAMPEDVARGDEYTKRKQRLFEMNKKAARFFFENLRSDKGKEARLYLKKRGLDSATISKYGLGYACATWTTLRDYMLGEGYSEQELLDASLIARSSKTGRTYDFFMNRVIFPFINLQGQIVGFGGRTLSADDQRKYLNTSETIVYKKSSFLFSMNFAKTKAAKEKRLLLCEGNMDVISLNQAGFENAVATCGTAITDEHARIMAQYVNEVIICYDSDEAGQKASTKAINMLSQVGVHTKILKMEGAKDPDEFIQKFGKERFAYILDNSEGALAYNLQKAKSGLDMDTDLGRIEYVKRASQIISEIQSRLEREIYISKLADEVKISKVVLTEEVENNIRKRKTAYTKKSWQQTVTEASRTTDVRTGEPTVRTRGVKAQEGVIAYLFIHPDGVKAVTGSLSEEMFSSEILRRIYKSLVTKLEGSLDYSLSAFAEEFDVDEMGRITKLLNLTKEIPITEDTLSEYIEVIRSDFDKSKREQSGEIDLAAIARRKRKE